MSQPHTATYWSSSLKLKPHPEGGWYRETYRAAGSIASVALPDGFDGDRNFSTAIYFLMTEGIFSAFHRIRSDEVWHFYTGDALLIHEIDVLGRYTIHRLGSDPAKEESFQLVIPAGSWFASEVCSGGKYGLVGCTVAPGFDFSDFEMADSNELTASFPQHAEVIGRLCR
jgi:uncharacterized protein